MSNKPIKKTNEYAGQPYFRKSEDNDLYSEYVSFDGRHKTIYNKSTHAIHRFVRTDSNYNSTSL